MSLFKVWVYKRHAQYPHFPPGQFHFMPEEAARTLIDAGCADDWQTDATRLHEVDLSEIIGREAPATKPVTKRAPPKRHYKRRDMTAEKP